jgi:acetylornithine deacetylase/succinyl-diaminopimelate desuccinylase-like protein
MTDARLGDTVSLLQQLIRNRCVNDGSPESGQERRNADLLYDYLEGPGIDLERLTAAGDRTSLVGRIEGSDPAAPKLCLMGHTDVVPVSPAGWREDPFGGDIIDGEVWGRGALDMLCITASMASVVRDLARSGWRPRGDLIYFAVADEEAGGRWGAEWVIDHDWDAVTCDYVLTEFGGSCRPDGTVSICTAEKGIAWRRLTVSGTPGHGSAPYRADNAIVKTAEVVQRIAAHTPRAGFSDLWTNQVASSGLSPDVQAALLDPARAEEAIAALPRREAVGLHAGCHTTLSCNVVAGGQKTNVIPDRVSLDVDIRTLPGISGADVDDLLAEVLGDLALSVTVEPLIDDEASATSTETPLWRALRRAILSAYPEATPVASLGVGATDARFFRRRNVAAYGAGLFSPSVDMRVVGARFHGNDERIDLESLSLCAGLWEHVARDLLD